MDLSDIEAALQKSMFFKGMSPHQREKIATLCTAQTYERGDRIFSQGELGQHLYLILKGQVVLERSVNLSSRSGNVVINQLGPNRLLGCWSTLLNEPHMLLSSAVCQKTTTVLAFKGQALRAMMESDLALGFTLFEKLCFLMRDRIQHAYGALEKI